MWHCWCFRLSMQANQFNQYGSEVLAVDSKLVQATRELRALDAQHVQLKNTAQMVPSATVC